MKFTAVTTIALTIIAAVTAKTADSTTSSSSPSRLRTNANAHLLMGEEQQRRRDEAVEVLACIPCEEHDDCDPDNTGMYCNGMNQCQGGAVKTIKFGRESNLLVSH